MALGNTPTNETTITVEASKSYALRMSFVTADGKPIDLTACKVRLVVGDTYTQLLEYEVDGSPSGVIKFMFQAADLTVDPGAYPYDVTVIAPTGYSTPILKGHLEVGANVDPYDANVYSDVNLGAGVTATVEQSGQVTVAIENIDGMYGVIVDLIDDFNKRLEVAQVSIQNSVKHAQASAESSAAHVAGLMAYMASVGFPYWSGTRAEYEALVNPSSLIMYLIKG